jgi:hypothetical protein
MSVLRLLQMTHMNSNMENSMKFGEFNLEQICLCYCVLWRKVRLMSLLPESSQLKPNDVFSECRSGKDLRQSCTIFSPRTVLIAVVGGQLIETRTDDIPLRAFLRIHNHRSEQKSKTQFWYITRVLKFSISSCHKTATSLPVLSWKSPSRCPLISMITKRALKQMF